MSAARNALGRGLGALLPSVPRTTQSDSTAAVNGASSLGGAVGELPRIRVDLIDPNPDQPRRVFDPERIEALAQSISRSGVLQPVVVRRAGARFELVVGERRWRASKVAGLETIPAVISDIDPGDRLELAIIENVQRHDLNPIELACAYRALAARGATQDEIGKRVGKDRSSVANHLRLLELSVEIQEDVENGRITMGHAKALLQVDDPERRRQLRTRVVSESLSVREAELLARELSSAPAVPTRKARSGRSEAAAESDPHLRGLSDLLARHFQSRVRILGTAASGRLEIEYGNAEDLDRIARLILEGL